MKPWELGLPREQVDPLWYDAMLAIKSGLEDQRRLIRDRE